MKHIIINNYIFAILPIIGMYHLWYEKTYLEQYIKNLNKSINK